MALRKVFVHSRTRIGDVWISHALKGLHKSAQGQGRASRAATLGIDTNKPVLTLKGFHNRSLREIMGSTPSRPLYVTLSGCYNFEIHSSQGGVPDPGLTYEALSGRKKLRPQYSIPRGYATSAGVIFFSYRTFTLLESSLESKKPLLPGYRQEGIFYKDWGGGVLLSHAVYPRSTIGAEELNDRVRDGYGCGLLAIATAPNFEAYIFSE